MTRVVVGEGNVELYRMLSGEEEGEERVQEGRERFETVKFEVNQNIVQTDRLERRMTRVVIGELYRMLQGEEEGEERVQEEREIF